MTASARKLATYADLLALPEDVRAELIDGTIVTQPGALPRHTRVQRVLGWAIGKPYDDDDGRGGPGGWWIFPEVDVAFGPRDVVRPDVSGWRRERLPDPGDLRPITIIPDWICEVHSPSTGALDRVTKRRMYARAGVAYYWLIDPAERVVEALALRDNEWREIGVYDDTAVARIEPFADVELEVGRLFLPR
ncbi:MAG TPA: Uma2 family endonuclease [Polyangiales bacterium]|nr:Uma2 family endonuclease [Polyangiales bacterium]